MRKVEGRFGKGDAVLVLGPTGQEVGRGLSRYDAAEAEKIMGLRSDAIEGVLGYTEGPTLIHADDLALAGQAGAGLTTLVMAGLVPAIQPRHVRAAGSQGQALG